MCYNKDYKRRDRKEVRKMRKRLFNYVVSRLSDIQLTKEEFYNLVQMWNAVDNISFNIMFHGYYNDKWKEGMTNEN